MADVRAQRSFFDGGRRLQMTESIELTIQSLQAYLPDHPDVGIAWSGGKDSSATLTLFFWLLKAGKIPRRAMTRPSGVRTQRHARGLGGCVAGHCNPPAPAMPHGVAPTEGGKT